jgi:hypothetical protein
MHATLAYLNAAGLRAARRTSTTKCEFLQVMDTLLANTEGASPGASQSKATSPRAIRKGAQSRLIPVPRI